VIHQSTQIAELRGDIAELLEFYEGEEIASLSDEPDTGDALDLSFDEYMAERTAAFDERIESMRKEIDENQARGTTADELHPDVQNLPHDTIKEHQSNPPDEEYSK
jgi:hypothetical protein